MGTSISTTRVTTYHGYPGHLLPASPVPGDYPLRPTEGPPDSNGDLEDLWEAEPLTLKRQNRGNDAQWLDNYLDNNPVHWMDTYDSNYDWDWADARQDFNPQIVHRPGK